MKPYGVANDDPAEALAYAFLEGAYDHYTGGFPSVPFHDGYRNYDERIEAWIAGSPRLDRERSEEKVAQWLLEYAAGAFARHLEKVWRKGQR